jgi:hypothetical protein
MRAPEIWRLPADDSPYRGARRIHIARRRRPRARRAQGQHDHRRRRDEGQVERVHPGQPALGRGRLQGEVRRDRDPRDKSTEGAPHTLSIVDQAPKTIAQIMGCKPCQQLMQAHQVDEQSGKIGQPLVESGADGLDTGGDSIVLAPKGKVTFKVTAKAGTTLHFLCAVHPWMLGTIKVS